MRTKWQILEERKAKLQEALGALTAYMQDLGKTSFTAPCTYCGEMLATEEDFAKHFLVPDERYLNLGECPKERRG